MCPALFITLYGVIGVILFALYICLIITNKKFKRWMIGDSDFSLLNAIEHFLMTLFLWSLFLIVFIICRLKEIKIA